MDSTWVTTQRLPFNQMKNMSVWKCDVPEYKDSRRRNDGLYLFRFAIVGVWLCVRGPKHISNYDEFWAAHDDGSLTPVWGSWDINGIMSSGVHSWDTFVPETGRWRGESYWCTSSSGMHGLQLQ